MSDAPTSQRPPNLFPNNSRRRIPGLMYVCIAIVCWGTWIWRGQSDPVLVNGGMLLAGGILFVVGVYSIAVGGRLQVHETQALDLASTAITEPIGHASAQLGWRGWRSRPTWRILWYSAEDPPTHRGLVLVDGFDGQILDAIVQDNPEDWSALDGGLDH